MNLVSLGTCELSVKIGVCIRGSVYVNFGLSGPK